MINKKNLWFLTLFSLILVLSVYYVTMPAELMLANNDNDSLNGEAKMEEENVGLIEALRSDDDSVFLEEINKLKATISSNEATTDDKNKAFDSLKLLNQISSKEELLEEKIKNLLNYDVFVKIDEDQIRVVVDSKDHSNIIANEIMRLVQDNFDTKKYISVQFK